MLKTVSVAETDCCHGWMEETKSYDRNECINKKLEVTPCGRIERTVWTYATEVTEFAYWVK